MSADFEPNLEFLDFPTAFAIQRKGIEHLHPKCSAVQTSGGILCDCGAVEAAYELYRDRGLAEWLAQPSNPKE